MRLEWLEDILAVLQTGSFVRAAEQRLVTQPAFSRRLKTIENYIGVELFDRSKKPAQLRKSVIDQQHRIRELVAGLHELRDELRLQERTAHDHVVIAGQHALSTSVAPSLMKKITAGKGISIRLRSANREECYALLMTKQVDLILIHQMASEELSINDGFLEQCDLGPDHLIPVCSPNERQFILEAHEKGQTPVIAYPSDSFLGQVMNQQIFPHIWEQTSILKQAEAALTPAVMQLALHGLGIAWLPNSLAAMEIASERLTDLSDIFPRYELSIIALRLGDIKSPASDYAWQIISSLRKMGTI